MSNSSKEDALSIEGLSIPLADGSRSQPINIDVYISNQGITPVWTGVTVPLAIFKSVERIEIFLDPSHPLFKSYGCRPEYMVAAEVAQYLYDTHRRLLSGSATGAHYLEARHAQY